MSWPATWPGWPRKAEGHRRTGGYRPEPPQPRRARLAEALTATVVGTPLSHASLVATQRRQWGEFYRNVHDRPVPRTYREVFAPDVDVRDPAGHWRGVTAWSAEEREAITLGVRAKIMDVLASGDITIVEIDFSNPAEWPGHCPPQATFIHRLSGGRSHQLRIHYPVEHRRPGAAEPA